MPITVRLIEEQDLPRVWAIHREGNQEIALLEPLLPLRDGPEAFRGWADEVLGEMQDDDHLHLVAADGAESLGWAHAHVAWAPDGERLGYVSAVYVARSARRRGAGTALLDEATRWLDEQKVTRIELLAASRSESRELWLRRGFRPLFETLVLDRGRP